MDWGLDSPRVDPAETLIALVSQSASRVAFYARLLQAQYDAAESKGQDGDAAAVPAGVRALIGHRYTVSEGTRWPVAEAIRGLVELEAQERERCAKWSAMAIQAGIAERAVRLAERQADLVVRVLTDAVGAAGLGEAERLRVLSVAAERLELMGEAS